MGARGSLVTGDFIEDFGQKVDLTHRIREVLLNYPEGTTILKELIQNADDAGATKVCFCVDRRQHGVESLVSSALAELQGPSLLAYNNAQFTEEDFASISRIGDSKKQGQAWKTGRFGVGFNSVYHLSDLPSFVSGKYVVLFDPHCKYLPRISSSNPGKRIDFVSSLAFNTYRDQFAPYCAFGCDMEKPYKGTLFRFPLRSVEQAAISRLSKQSYTADDMSSLLHHLYLEGVPTMLFLKNVEVMEVYEWTTEASSPSQLYSCFVKAPSSDIRWHRQAFSRLSKAIHSTQGVAEEVDVYRLDLVSKAHQGIDCGKETLSSFIIAQVMGSPTSRISALAKNALKDYGLHLVPWASVAADVSSMPGKETEREGRAFCFLPLPVRTGLSVHVNGYFELSANRRDIWYGSDMDRMGKIRSDWNQCLLEDVAAFAFSRLLYEARKIGAGPIYYSMWPQGNFGEPWLKMVRQFYRNIMAAPLLYSAVRNGKWMSPAEAIFHDEEYGNADVLADALIAERLPLVRPPKELRSMLVHYCVCDAKMVTPNGVRTQLRKNIVHQGLVQRGHAFTLLDYCLSDVVDEEAADDLRGLPLVPLENQKFGVFGLRDDGNSYFLCSDVENSLLKAVPEKVVDQSLPKMLADRLNRIATLGWSNVRLLDDAGLVEVLHCLMPSEWRNCNEVYWKPGRDIKHPTEEWLALLWDCLHNRQTDLSMIEEWPILPTTSGRLCRPIQNSGLLRSGKMSKSMEAVLIKIGCQFLNTRTPLQHPHLPRYAPDPSAAVILDALAYVVSNDLSQLAAKFDGVSDIERRDLRNYLYEVCWLSKNEMNDSRILIFKSLPIFEAYTASGVNDRVFLSVEGSKKFLAPSGVDDMLLGPEFLHSYTSREAEVLTQLLAVITLKRAEFFKWRVISRITEIPAQSRDQLMLQILRELPQLSVEDRSIVEVLKHVAFVPTGDGKLRAPEFLYDPENLELLNLLNDQEFFPSAEYSAPDVLQVLRSLGMRTSVLPDTILSCARRVESLVAIDPDKAAERGRVLLSYVDMNSRKWLSSRQEAGIGWVLSKASTLLQGERDNALTKFWSELGTICWCPVLMQPPHSQMPWPAMSQRVAPPKLIRLQSDMWLVSATMRILDGHCHSPGVCQRLGWSSKLGGNILAAQLLELGKKNDTVDQLGKVLATTVPKIYSLLSEMLGSDDMEIVKAILEGSRWIWVGSGFAKAEEVVFDGPLHLAPYLHVVPADLAVFKDLFVELGVRESLNPLGYSLILSSIASEKRGECLDSRQLAAVIWIVQHLADMCFGEQGKEIFIPDNDAVLVPSSQLVYNDAPWLLASKDLQTDAIRHTYKFVHAKISNDVADKVGVSSVRRSLLAESADFMELGLHGGMEAFGQSESLTNRLKHIVEMYADGPGILFELLQNADDAGACEVCFLLDKTHYGTNSVLCRQMADWQGPALYCYNNSVFKPEDLYAISRIGQNSKLEKPSAIGRFGLGFNSIYHFTDVPGFISGANIVMLDPHAANLPGITPAQPGLKINFVGRGLLNQFPDQFEPYLLFGCDLQKPFQGTLFRFPLRTEATAPRSEIKREAYKPEDVATLFSALEMSCPEVLLFLRNVKCIKVYEREDPQHEMKELYKVCKQNIDYQENKLYEFVRGSGQQQSDKVQLVKRLENTSDKHLPWACGKIKLTLASAGADQCSSWLVSSALGGSNAKEFVVAAANRSRGFVPWAGIAAKLSEGESGEGGKSLAMKFQDGLDMNESPSLLDGRAFCFLPLPVKVGLPVHVNGYFELSANRRDIWYGGDMVGGGRLRSQWNSYLLEDAAAPAYAHLLHQAARELGPCAKFHSLWPTGDIAEPWKLLMKQVYNSVVDLDLPVLYTSTRGGKWISANQAVFPDFSFAEMNELGNALIEVGLPLVSVPKLVVSKFQEVHPSLRFLTPQLLRRLLIASRRTFERRVSLLALKYSLSDVDNSEAEEKLYGLSLIPLANGFLGTLNSRLAGERIILTGKDDYELLKDAVPHMLADPEIGDDVSARLKKVASNGTSNVMLLTPQVLKELLPMVLPLEWAGKDFVAWTPGLYRHPTLAWMDSLWRYLGDRCHDLSVFANWPLLPTSDNKLLQLVQSGPVIFNDGWSENMAILLQSSGCFLLRKDISVKHPSLREYVHDATAHGVLLAMFSAAGGNLKMVPTLLRKCSTFEVRELRHFLFQSKWFTSSQMDVVQLQVLRMLRLFESCRALDSSFLCIAESNQFIAPDGIDEQLLGDMFIRAEPGKEESILETYLGLKKLSKKEYFLEYFAECISQVAVDQRMQAFLKAIKDMPLLMEMAPSSIKSLSQLPFVPTALGTIEAPEKLYDPRISELQTLLSRQAFFPSDEFAKDEVLDVLVYLGLKRSLGRDGLLDGARSVAMISTTDESEASRRGKALLAHMDSLVATDAPMTKAMDPIAEGHRSVSPESLLLDAQFWMELSSISWCPVYVSPPNPVLPWLPGQLSPLAPPKLVRPASDIWLVSSAMRILDGGCCEPLIDKLGWKQTPNAGVLANQLIELSNRYKELASAEETASTISKEIQAIYNHFQEFMGTEAILVVQSMLEGRAWLWIGEGFVRAREAAFDAPAHFHPYLHAVPLELVGFKELFAHLGVRGAFAAADYVNVLQCVAADVKGDALNSEQLTFVLRLLEALVDVLPHQGSSHSSVYESILIPDATSYLVPAKGLVYNDAPWLAKDVPGVTGILRLVHPDVDNDLARQLGAKSLRYLSVVDQEMTSSLPCMGITRISELLTKVGSEDLLLFDFLEIADCCQARKVHFVFDNREHPKQSLLQPNLSDFQGPALLVAFEDAALTTEEICALHAAPPVKLHGLTCRYGSGLLGAYHLTDLLFVISSGCLYLFDPSGQILAPALADGRKASSGNPIGKAFSLQGTGLTERFGDQFQPFQINDYLSWDSPNVTIFRLPLRTSIEDSEVHHKDVFKLGTQDISQLFQKFKQHAATCLLSLKSVEDVALSEWPSVEPLHEVYSVSLGSGFASLRHPFQEKKWRKFQLSNFFGNSNAATKIHTIDVLLTENGAKTVTKWLVVQSLAAGHTRDMALDRRYLHYQLTPIAGVAACISADGGISGATSHGSILSPLPVPLDFTMPVTIFGNFLLSFNGGRHFFNESLGDYPVKVGVLGSHTGSSLSDEIICATWNRQLLSCVCDSYIELLQELQHLHLDQIIAQVSSMDDGLGQTRSSYSLWPRSRNMAFSSTADARCLIKWLIKPMYTRLVDLPVWQLHAGTLVKFSEGVFVAPSGQGVAPKKSVSNFLKAHYRIFAVPWELGKEVEEIGIPMKELTPKALRSLMKVPSVAAAVQSLTTQIDLLEYCCADALPENIYLGDENESSISGRSSPSDNSEINAVVLSELKGVTCPTANEFMVKLGTLEMWVASSEQQLLLPGLLKRFVHPLCLERPLLAVLLYNKTFQLHMNLKSFSSQILAANLWTVLPKHWPVARNPWVQWEHEPSVGWILNFWKNVDTSSAEELLLFASWPLVPATNSSSTVLVRVGQRQIVFAPPNQLDSQFDANEAAEECTRAFAEVDDKYPWLIPLLCKLGVPVYNRKFLDCRAICSCLPERGQSLVHTVISKLVALLETGCLHLSRISLTSAECDQLFTFFVKHTDSDSSLTMQELSLLGSMPIYKTRRGNYVGMDRAVHYVVPPGAFLQPDDERCLPYLDAADGGTLYQLLAVPELRDSEVLVRYALPNFGYIVISEQEKVLTHIYQNWSILKEETAVVNALKETSFVQSASTDLCRPSELLDPENVILKQVFAEERLRFPGGQFATSRWLQILRTAGLRSIKDTDLVLECARKIEELGRQDLSSHDLSILRYDSNGSRNISDAVWSMGSMLVEEILSNFATIYSGSFCDALSKIAFVPAEKGVPTMAGGVPSRVLASYSEAILVKDWPLGWTCSPLLTRSNMVPPEFSWGALHLRSPPLISVVIKHLQEVGKNGGEDVLTRWPNTKGSKSVEDVFGDVLHYLSNAWDGLSNSDKKELSRHAFIPVANGTRLVTASSLYTRLGMDLAPFVFEVPRAYIAYVNILSALGMQYEPTIATMKGLLLQLQQTCGYQHLNPNELHAVLSILRLICDIDKNAANQDLAEDAVVPDENARLVHASSCAYVDTAGARLFGEIDSTRVRLVHPSLPEGLCTVLGVKKLSDIILEEIDEEQPLDYLDSFNQFYLSLVKERLQRRTFGESIWILLRAFEGAIASRHLTKEQVMDSILFGAQNLRFVRRLYTKYLLLPGRKDITRYLKSEENSRHQSFYFLNRLKNLVLVAEPPEFLSVPDLLAVVVSQLLECSICLPIGPLFNISIDLDTSLEQVVRLVANGSDINRQGSTGTSDRFLGAAVLPIDAKGLQFCPLRPFYSGEIVAWHPDGQTAQLRYGRVIEDIRAPAGQPLYHIRVETGPGETRNLSSSNVLSFKSTGTSTLAEQKLKAKIVSAVEISPSTSSDLPVASQEQQHADEPSWSLQATGYAQAITDILTSLGLPLSLERQALLEHTLSLQEQLTSANSSLLSEQERADAAVKEAETVKSSWTCRICLSSEVDSLLVPCGHVLCHRCSSAVSRCPFCRQFVSTTHRMYRP